MKKDVIIRIIFGIIFFVLGYILATNTLPQNMPFRVPFSLAQALIAFLAGAFGIFLLPVVSQAIGEWTKNLMVTVAKEVAEQTVRLKAVTARNYPQVKTKRKFEEKVNENPMVMDTSAIIDGRIAEIAQTGFISGTFIIPKFVLAELQRIADSADALRRGRGRRGLEILDELKKCRFIKFEIVDQDYSKAKDVDDKLVRFAKQFKTKIVTTDFNLNKVASVSGIKTLNVNELSNSLKTVALPGEELTLKVIQEGKEQGQGVGYLPDGTMIVVEEGSRFIGKTIQVTVSRVLQTVAGRMIFVQIKKEVENGSNGTKQKE